jgi:hypothetical protein
MFVVARRFGVLLAVWSLLAGCGAVADGPPVSQDLRRTAARVALLDGWPSVPYRRLRHVEAVSCAREIAADPDVEGARGQLKIEAARLGGNGVANVMCEEERAGPGIRCWKVVRCVGDVVRAL